MPHIPTERSSSAPKIVGVLLYLCPHLVTQNDQIWHSNTYGEGLVFRQSATPSISRRRGPSAASGPNFAGYPLLMRTRFDL